MYRHHVLAFNPGQYLLGRDRPDGLFGGDGADRLYAGDGDDVLNGGAGNDLLLAGGMADRLRGGSGADVFVFVNTYLYDTATGIGPHVVTDFNVAEDRLLMDFTAEGTAEASFDDFMSNARQAGDAVLYVNPTDGWRIRLAHVTLAELTLANFLPDQDPMAYYRGWRGAQKKRRREAGVKLLRQVSYRQETYRAVSTLYAPLNRRSS